MIGSGLVLLAILVTLQRTVLFRAVSTFILVLTITLGFILFRTGVKLYMERQTNRPRVPHQVQAGGWRSASRGRLAHRQTDEFLKARPEGCS